MQKRRKPEEGEKVYELTPNNLVSEWIVEKVSKSRFGAVYRLSRESGDSFCTFTDSDLGRRIFINKDDAVKEMHRKAL